MKDISRKTEQFTDSVIRRMTRISLACGAINLAQGYPDFDPPKAITDRLAQAPSAPISIPSPWAPPTSARPWLKNAAISWA